MFQKQEPKLKYPPIWEYDFKVGYFSSIDPILYEDKVIYSGLDDKRNDFSANSTLEAFDKENGDQLWVWDDAVEVNYGQFNFLGQNYIDDNVLHISTGVDYAINLDNGKTVDYYDESPRIGGQNFSGINNLIFSDYYSNSQEQTILKYTETKNFQWKTLESFHNSDTIRYGFSEAVFKNDKMIIPFTEWNPTDKNIQLSLKTYDITSMSSLSKQVFSDNLFESSLDYPPLLVDETIYMSLGGKIAAVNCDNADIMWQQNTEYNSSRSGIMYADNKLFVNTEFVLYALDAETGDIIWQIESRAGSRMQDHKGVVYYRSGSVLRGVDMATGEILLEIEAPSRASDDGAYFQPVLTIDHENDRIYTASYTHAYCYPTLR